ncbi:sigma-54-dependent transcriptional regulator [Sphingomonas sp. Y38-1Y]|uniref:sigma-54-dependent transcriptional regulator n=1 Tax=Sphingomonas sp. Y38-1Y TaxID=3078265 RepID=UPI00396486C4
MGQQGKYGLCVVVDDDPDILTAARLALRGLFEEVVTCAAPDEARRVVEARRPDIVLLDANFARGATDAVEGLALLEHFLAADPGLAVVMITAHAGIHVAVEAMKRGAADFVAKPWSNDRLVAAVRSAAALGASRRTLPPEVQKSVPPPGSSALIGGSPAMARIHALIGRAAPTEANVLVLGENGTGKELVARALHAQSRRAARPMVTIDLGAIAPELIDSELFGHVKGAFTDARADRVGRIQAADGGTLFLDEIGNLPLHLQPKLLTALEQRRITPVGANREVPVDIRVVAATNMTPAALRDPRHFRQDLLFRLNTVEIELPPLRERREDVAGLIDHYLALHAERYGRAVPALAAGTMAALSAAEWPGNVRALRHATERAVILGGEAPLTAADFGIVAAAGPILDVSVAVPEVADLNLDRVERRLVETALRKHGYNISAAATELGLSRAALYRRMEKHGL